MRVSPRSCGLAQPYVRQPQTRLNGGSISRDGLGRCDVHHEMADCDSLRCGKGGIPFRLRRAISLPIPRRFRPLIGSDQTRAAGNRFGAGRRPNPSLRYLDPPPGAVHCRNLSSVAFDLGESSSGGALAPRGYRACRSARRALTNSMPRPTADLSSSAEADESSAEQAAARRSAGEIENSRHDFFPVTAG
jgi:hypothetical protein